MIKIITENISWVKDIFSILFSGVVAVIAILTFLRAKETFLQPVRTEIIKRQTELLAHLLDDLYKNKDFEIDYEGLIKVNTFNLLLDYGFILKDQDKIKEDILNESDRSMIIFADKNGVVDEFEVIKTFENENKITGKTRKEKYEEAKNGTININKIFITKKHRQYMDKLDAYIENPLMPTRIRICLEKIKDDVMKNIKVILRGILLDFVKKILNEGHVKFSIAGVFNDFNHKRIHHVSDYDKLKLEVRDYLKIDTVL